MTSKEYSLKQYKLTERRPQEKMTIGKMTIGKMTIGKMTIEKRPQRKMPSKEDDLRVRQPDNFIEKLECGSAQPSLLFFIVARRFKLSDRILVLK